MARKRLQFEFLPKLCLQLAESALPAEFAEVRSLSLHGTQQSIRERIREECPAVPGVYGMLNEEGHVFYVGMSYSLPSRLQNYFSKSRHRRREGRIRRKARGLVWQPLPHPLVARIRERELIRRIRPEVNVMGQPDGLRVGYIVTVNQSAPSFELLMEVPSEHGGVWGPIPFSKKMQAAVESINLQFGLRDCPRQTLMQFRGETSGEMQTPPACLRADLGTCLAPCAAGCSRRQYDQAFKKAKRFLDGQSQQVLQDLQQEMLAASEKQLFERAGRLRDRFQVFTSLSRTLRRFHDWSHRASFVYPLDATPLSEAQWLIVVRGRVRSIEPVPETESARNAMIDFIEAEQRMASGKESQRRIVVPGEFEAARLMYRWFRKYPEEQQRQLTLKRAISQCRRQKRRAS